MCKAASLAFSTGTAARLLTVRHGCRSSFPHTEWVTPNEVGAWCVWVIQCVEKEWCGGSQQILDVLFQGVDVLATGCLGNEAVVVDGVDVLLARDCITETSAGTVLEANTPSLVAERLLNVCSGVDVVIEPAKPARLLIEAQDQIARRPTADVVKPLTLRGPALCAMGRHPE